MDRDSLDTAPRVSLVQLGMQALGAALGDFRQRVDEWEAEMVRKRRVLVVEDDAATLAAVCGALGEVERTEIVPAQSGEAAVREIAQRAFDLLVVDLNLGGGLTGMAVVDHARRHNEVVPIVLLSGIDGDELARIARRCRANAWREKPCDARELAALVAGLLS